MMTRKPTADHEMGRADDWRASDNCFGFTIGGWMMTSLTSSNLRSLRLVESTVSTLRSPSIGANSGSRSAGKRSTVRYTPGLDGGTWMGAHATDCHADVMTGHDFGVGATAGG
jgi:hypothetical protein